MISLPPSKSISARALIINALAEKACPLQGLSDCDDTRALQSVLQGGADVGAAGTAMRFATAFLAATHGTERTLTGTPRMLQRPIAPLVDALRQLGADIEYAGEEGFPPLVIRGRRLTTERLPLSSEGIPTLSIPAHISSQYVSALMMIAPTLYSPLRSQGDQYSDEATRESSEGLGMALVLDGPIASRPYIEMTRALMDEWGCTTKWCDDKTLFINTCAYVREAPYVIEADWSAASYFLVADRTLQFPGLQYPSIQGDSVIVDMLQRLDANVGTAEVLRLDFASCPDLAQTMTVAACLAGQPFLFTGLASLRIKETDRIAALTAECAKFGWNLSSPVPDTLAWDGVSLPAAESIEVQTYNDHRMAMAFAPCLLRYPYVTFDNPEVVSKSFPSFWKEFQKIIPQSLLIIHSTL